MKQIPLKIFTLALFILAVLPDAFAQDFILKGVVMEKGTKKRIETAHIQVKRTGIYAFSNNFGLFEIKARVGDTLLIIRTEFNDQEVPVSSNKDLVVYLDRGTMLREVNINGQTKKQELTSMKKEYQAKGSFYQGKPPVLSFFFKPLTALYELFGRTPKNARRFARYYETELQQTLIDGFFNETIIQENTDLKGDELEKFMQDYRPEYEKAVNWGQYDAIKHIKDSYKKYKETLKK
ncbi:hypothetical protein [Pedobacter metabolipauper]|nr:hypothetical protein [Pedobacter metabolipauper]